MSKNNFACCFITTRANKSVIPLNLERGQISWSSYGGTNHVLSGRSHQSSISEGVSNTYDCRNCCPDDVTYYWVVPGLTTVGYGEHVDYFAAGETESCYAFAQFQNFPITGWSSSDTSVAAIDYSGGAEAVSGGDALQSVEWNSYEWEYIIPTGECARTDTPGQGASTMEVQCAYPVNFRQEGEGQDIGDGKLRFKYIWDSYSGNKQHLSDCWIGEVVTYPGITDYQPLSPPFAAGRTYKNPIIINFPATDPYFTDTHSTPGPFVSPFTSASFTATQYYRYKCPCMNSGDYVNLMGPISIIRSVDKNPILDWWVFKISKSGASASLLLGP